jgi:hypothetical protein
MRVKTTRRMSYVFQRHSNVLSIPYVLCRLAILHNVGRRVKRKPQRYGPSARCSFPPPFSYRITRGMMVNLLSLRQKSDFYKTLCGITYLRPSKHKRQKNAMHHRDPQATISALSNAFKWFIPHAPHVQSFELYFRNSLHPATSHCAGVQSRTGARFRSCGHNCEAAITSTGTENPIIISLSPPSSVTELETHRYIFGSVGSESALPFSAASGCRDVSRVTTDGVGISAEVEVDKAIVRLFLGRDCFLRRRLIVLACTRR